MSLENNIKNILETIERKKAECGINYDIKLIAVSKTKRESLVKEAYQLGLAEMGENKVLVAESKVGELKELNINWHLIGGLQTNKVRQAVEFASLIHSVDRLSLAQEISKRAGAINKTQEILIQVNTSDEDTKSGIEPVKALEFLKQVSELPNLKITGFMTISKLDGNESEVRDCFKILKNIYDEAKTLNIQNTQIKNLSMGMSGDFEIAIEEGANMLRIGSSIFGGRDN